MTATQTIDRDTKNIFLYEWHEDGRQGQRSGSANELAGCTLGIHSAITFDHAGLSGVIGGDRGVEIQWAARGASKSEFVVDYGTTSEGLDLAITALNHAISGGIGNGFTAFPDLD